MFLSVMPVFVNLYACVYSVSRMTVRYMCSFISTMIYNPTPLPIFSQLHLAALASLKGDVGELNKRLVQTEQERDLLEKRLAKAQVNVSLYHHLGMSRTTPSLMKVLV